MPSATPFQKLLHSSYSLVKAKSADDAGGAEAEAAILALVEMSVTFLVAECNRVPLISLVAGKTYAGYARKDEPASSTRPVRDSLFAPDVAALRRHWNQWRAGRLSASNAESMLYTAALAPCLAMELYDRANKKGPATYFECFVGHVVARTLGLKAHKKASLPFRDINLRLTMDLLFQPTATTSGLHVAVKMSTRERVVQAWAHQRLLDSAFGPSVYRGIMILFGETKLDVRKGEVVEICVPDQWLAYQTLLAPMARIYYFDPPTRYVSLAEKYPDIVTLAPFATFLGERGELIAR